MPNNDWENEADASAKKIEQAIADFERKYTAGFLSGEVDFRNLKDDATEVRGLFKGIKLKREVREKLWERTNVVTTAAFDARTRMFEKRKLDSSQKRAGIEPLFNSAMGYASGGTTTADFDKARNLLAEGLGAMKNGWGGYNVQTEMMKLSEGRLTKEDREALWTKYTAAQDTLHRRREQVSESNFNAMMSNARTAVQYAERTDDFKAASEHLKMIGREVKNYYIHKEHRLAIHAELSKGFEVLGRRSGEKHQQWVDGGRAKITRLTEAVSRKHGQISALRSQIDHLNAKASGHWSDDYISQTNTWIAEKEAAIRQVESEISDIESKIREIERELYK